MTLDLQVLWQETGGGETYGQWLLSAWGWTLAVSGCALAVALAVGSLMGILRTTPSKALRGVSAVWTELFRNIPLLVQIFLWYQVIPALVPPLQGVSSFLLVVLALGFFTSARIAEQVRAGIQSLPQGQGHAAQALGFTWTQTYRYVLLPLAFRIILPPLTSESMSIIKNSSVAFAVSVSELTLFALQAGEETARNLEMYLVATLAYFLSAFAVNRLLQWVEQRVRVPGMIGSA